MQELLIYLYDTCCLSEVSIIGWFLNHGEQLKVSSFALQKTEIVTLEGWHITPDYSIDDLDVNQDYLGLIFPGGVDIFLDPKLKELILDFDAKKKLIGAICAGPTHLALAGLLTKYKYTTSLNPEHFEENRIEDPFPWDNFQSTRAFQDSHIITSTGVALAEFTDLVFNYLGQFENPKERKEFQGMFTPNWNYSF